MKVKRSYFVEINDENKGDFAEVLPELLMDNIGLSVGAINSRGEVCGAISLSFDGAQYDIDWIYVTEEMRLTGVGRGLVTEVKRMVDRIGICPIYAQFDPLDDSGLYGFFLSLNSTDLIVDVSYSHDRYVVDAQDFLRSEHLKMKKDPKYMAEPLWELEEEKLESAMGIVLANYSIRDPEVFEESCEKNLCFAVQDEDHIRGLMIVQKLPGGDLLLSYIYSRDPRAAASLLMAASLELKRNYKHKKIYFDVVSREAEIMAKNFFPGVSPVHIYEADL